MVRFYGFLDPFLGLGISVSLEIRQYDTAKPSFRGGSGVGASSSLALCQ